MKKKISRLIRGEGGAITVMAVIMIFAFLGILAVVIDLGHLHTVQGELRNAADACALRGARAFLPDDIDISGAKTTPPNPDEAKNQAELTIVMNKTDNLTLDSLPQTDMTVGIWDYKARDWVPGTTASWSWPPAASLWGEAIGPGISLPVKREGTQNLGPVSMTLAAVLSIFKDDTTVPVRVMATAALSGVGELTAGYGAFPIAVNEDLLTQPDATIYLSPDNTDVGGWTSLTPSNPNANVVKNLVDNPTDNPKVSVGDSIGLLNGSACSIINEAIKEYPAIEDPKGVYKLTPPVDVLFPVVNNYKMNQSGTVLGFMLGTILYFVDTNAAPGTPIPDTNPPQVTDGHCNIVITPKPSNSDLPGGGNWYGLLSTQPKLVQ
jgi:hypothetical protein